MTRRPRAGAGRPLPGLAVVAMALAAAIPNGAGAQDEGVSTAASAGDTMMLGLDDAIRLAEGGNPAYRRASNSLELNGTEMTTAWATRILPRATLNLFDTNYSGNLQKRATDNFGNPIENPQSDWVYFSRTNQSLSLNWSVQGASILNSLRRQRRTNFDRDLDADRARTELRGQVRRQFFDVLEQRDLLDAERQLADSRAIDQELTDRLFRLARTNRVDVLNAELATQQQALAVERQRAAFEQSRLALRTLLGDPDLPPLRLADEPLPVFDPSGLDADALVARALEVNPEVRQASSGVASAALGVKEARTEWWPDLTFGLNFYRRAQATKQSALFDLSFDEDLESNFFISLSLPFFNSYFENRQAIERAEVDLENQRESMREARLGVEEQVRAALSTLRNQHESLRLAARSAEIASEALELAREEYRIGTRTFEQLRQSVEQEGDTRRQVIEARYGFVDALIALEEAVGAPVQAPPPAADGGA